MWCACKVGPRHWEENFIVVDWKKGSLVAFANQESGERFAAKSEKPSDDDDAGGKTVCSLVGLRVNVDSSELREECETVTCGDYDQVLMLSPPNTEFVCVVGIEDRMTGSWLRWIENSASICTYLDACNHFGIDPELELVADFQSAVQLPGEIVVTEKADLLDTKESTRAFLHLLNSQTTSLSLFNTAMLPSQSSLFFESFRGLESLRVLHLKRCGISPQSSAQLCKGLLGISSHLEELDITHNHLGDVGASGLSETLPCLVSLVSLKLGDNNIGPEGARAIGSTLRRLLKLRCLEMFQNEIKDAGLVAIASSLGSLAYLENLILYHCGALEDNSLQRLVQGLIENTNVSVVGGIHCLDLQDNSFDGNAIRRFLTQCSGLGTPQIIKLGRKRKGRMMMAMKKGLQPPSLEFNENQSFGTQFRSLQAALPQVIDLGFIPQKVGDHPFTENGTLLEDESSRVPQLEIVFGKEISPFKLVQAITNLLGLFPGQAKIVAGQAMRKDNMQAIRVEIDSQDGLSEEHCADLINMFNEGNAVLHLLHVVTISLVGIAEKDFQLDQSEKGDYRTDRSKISVKRPEHLLIQPDLAVLPGDTSASSKNELDERTEEEVEEDLMNAVYRLLSIDDVSSSIEAVRAQLRTIANAFERLNLVVPSDPAQVKRFLLEARLDKTEFTMSDDLLPRIPDGRVEPILAAAIGRLATCSPSDALIVRAFYAAMHGDVEKCVSASQQGKYALGMMLSISQVTSFESATLQAAVVSQNPDLFALVMAQDLVNDESTSRSIRLAHIIHHDLFARSIVVQKPLPAITNAEFSSNSYDDPAGYAGLVIELTNFSRLNAKWTPRELRLQFFNQVRLCPLTMPIKVGQEHVLSEDEIRYWKSLGEVRAEEAYSKGAVRVSELLLQAMGDSARSLDDPDGVSAAHEAFGIAFSNRAVGLVDELICQLLCQVSCNPSLRSADIGWRLIVLALRFLTPSSQLCSVLSAYFENRIGNDLNVGRLVFWAQEALQRFVSSSPHEKKVRKVFAADSAIRMDVMRQVLCNEDAFEIDIHCANGTGTRAKISPFTSFENLLQQIDGTSTGHLFRIRDPKFAQHGHRQGRSRTLSGASRVSEKNSINQEARWRDFVFIYESEHGEREILPWDADVFWWRWECAVGQILSENSNGDQNKSSLKDNRDLSNPFIVRLLLETAVLAPSLWFYDPHVDPLRCELSFWQSQSAVVRGDLCTSNPEALSYLCCISACVRITGGCNQFVKIDPVDQIRICMGHLPTAVRKRVGKGRSNPWNKRFASVVTNFAFSVGRIISSFTDTDGISAEDSLEELGLSSQMLQRAYVAYLDTWPLAGGTTFRHVMPRHLSILGEPLSLNGYEDSKYGRSRVVVNQKGVFLLVLTKDAHTSRGIGVLWWTPIDDILNVQLTGADSILITARESEVEMSVPNVRKLYKNIVAQSTANLSMGNPRIPREVKLVQFAHSFRALPWPPSPPSLFRMRGEPLDMDRHISLELDFSTTASLLAQFL